MGAHPQTLALTPPITGSELQGSTRLRSEYLSKRSQYQSQPYIKDYAIDAELVENITRKMKRRKAGDLEGITREHLIFSHALLPCILAKLFVLMINNYVPISFGILCLVTNTLLTKMQ